MCFMLQLARGATIGRAATSNRELDDDDFARDDSGKMVIKVGLCCTF